MTSESEINGLEKSGKVSTSWWVIFLVFTNLFNYLINSTAIDNSTRISMLIVLAICFSGLIGIVIWVESMDRKRVYAFREKQLELEEKQMRMKNVPDTLGQADKLAPFLNFLSKKGGMDMFEQLIKFAEKQKQQDSQTDQKE